jgi:putative hemolysin
MSGWFAATETALTNISPTEIAQMRTTKQKNVDFVVKTKRNLDRTLVTILILNNIVNIVLSSVAAVMANELFQAIGVTIMVALITFLIIIFGEIIPKSNAIWNTKKVVLSNSKPIHYMTRGLNPMITLFTGISRGILKMAGKNVNKTHMLLTDESIKSLATLGEEEGLIKKVEKDIIHNVFIFGDKQIKDIMVPQDKIFFLKDDLSVQIAGDLVAKGGFTRIPVRGEDNKVVGVLYSKDLIEKNEGFIKPLLKPPFFINSEDDITVCFKKMREKRVHMAIVKNDQETCIGIVTLEDILEELVGEIYDEYFEVKYGRTSAPAPS